MRVIGLTGGIASGKSTAADRLRELGAFVIDADKLGHQVLEPGGPAYQPVLDAFGASLAMSDGRIDRRALGAIVFADPAKLQRLNAISHPAMEAETAHVIERERAGGRSLPVVIDAAILFEAGWDRLCDEVWCVAIPEDLAAERLMKRNNLSESEAKARIASQMPIDEKRARADVVIPNMHTIADLHAHIDRAWDDAVARSAE